MLQNDDFGARYYSWRVGRWLSADWSAVPAPVPYANLTNPQTLNLYAMVSDNPETFADLDGHQEDPEPEPEVKQEEKELETAVENGEAAMARQQDAADAADGAPGSVWEPASWAFGGRTRANWLFSSN